MDAQTKEFKLKYDIGRQLLEKGQYRLSVQSLEEATQLVNPNSRLGGDVQMILVTAYQAVGRLEDAINLCQNLTVHPHVDIRKQSQRILYILKAPQLKRPEEWMTKIPTIDTKEAAKPKYITSNPTAKLPEKSYLTTEDLSQIDTRDNYFIWFALGLIVLILSGLVWFN
ncbi:tetratricopeptide repeat protein [Aphanothece sacrum]|uniref:TPR repeat-containing protein n=1 Tax=Aphanothece sacrum FPU1 TaxID=1920663 RepID=A0A401INU5_APHSA|nr:tetratricopeptide repeat protein [Aphanothece sacrum]GBF82912.1 TPR repeat-containing protein [Aphanothece sacrum FPU1]GBF86939.1 TPR repeat-containing protein [Aphanothece sacrum FPU3]